MARLIDADILKENCRITGEFMNNFECVSLKTLGEIIDKQPTIDPVKHGKWVYKPTSEYDGYIVCSNCDVYIPSHKLFGKDDEYTNTSNYCPHCGARMDGE